MGECSIQSYNHFVHSDDFIHVLFFYVNAANHSDVWTLATSMESHKSEIENWDLGAGIYIAFYLIRSSLQEENSTTSELVRIKKTQHYEI